MEFSLIAATFSWGSLESWWAILQMVAGLGFVIFVHELGHFLVAKACGVRCDKFYVGFDMFDIKIGDTVIVPRALLKKQWGETEYGIGIVPLGGYVKMLGQDDNPARAEEERQNSMVKKEDAEESDEEAYELDPRSYQAKSVGQRMAIISAGVVMNLIFAAIFAAIAYSIGVEYQPAIVGSTVAGGPAWERNIRPGDRIVAIGEKLEEREHLRFNHDVVSAIAYNGDIYPIPILMESHEDGSRRTIKVQPSVNVYKQKKSKIALIGIAPAAKTALPDIDPTQPGTAAAEASADGNGFKAGDTVIQLDDEKIESIIQMRKYLALHAGDTVRFTVERKPEIREGATEEEIAALDKVVESFDVKPNLAKRVGLVMHYGSILAIQDDSPAAAAGLLVGDEIVGINDEPIGDPLTLSRRLRPFALNEESVQLKIRRSGSEQTIEVAPRLPYTSTRYSSAFDQRIAVNELGVAFAVKNIVASVEPGSSADNAGLESGDVLMSVQYKSASKEELEENKKRVNIDEAKPFEFEDMPNAWPYLLTNQIQHLVDSTEIILTFDRNGQSKQAIVKASRRDDQFLDTRGIIMSADTRIHKSKSMSESAKLGIRQTWEDSTKIYGLLYKLFSGQVSPVNLGGPGTIASAATQEALSGPSHLLMFLTLLSANLAIVNFLPIPVLDGGHMVFLLYEAIFRRPVGEKLQFILSISGLIFIVGLMLTVISLDLWRFLG